jgi:hypothetical protein
MKNVRLTLYQYGVLLEDIVVKPRHKENYYSVDFWLFPDPKPLKTATLFNPDDEKTIQKIINEFQTELTDDKYKNIITLQKIELNA